MGWQPFVSLGTLVSGGISILVFSSLWGWPVGVFIVLLLYAHEFGHVIAARWRGVDVQGPPIFLPGFGAYIVTTPHSGAWDQILISLAGPTIGAGVAFAAMMLGIHLESASLVEAGRWGLIVNLLNLAPFQPLDGGRIISQAGWVGFLLTLLMGGLVLFVLKVNDWFLVALVAFGIMQALGAARERSPLAWTARVGVLGLYGGAVIALTLALMLGEWGTSARGMTVKESDFRGGGGVVVQQAFAFAFGIYLLGVIALPYAWRRGQSIPVRYLVSSLVGWPQYLISRPWMIPVSLCLAVETLGLPGARWLENLIRSSSKKHGALASAGCAFGYDCLAWRSRGQAMAWLQTMTPALRSGGLDLLNPTYRYLLLLGHQDVAHRWLASAVSEGDVRSDPSRTPANTGAWARLQFEHAPVALPLAQAAVQAEPNNPDYQGTLGSILLALGSAAEAERRLRWSLGRRDDVSDRLCLAQALAAQGRHTEAIAEIERVLSTGAESWPGDAPSPVATRELLEEWRGSARQPEPGVIAIPKTARHGALGKVIAVLLIGFFVGYGIAGIEATNYKRAQTLTLEKYTAQFEKYRNSFLHPMPLWAAVLLATLLAAAVFGIYEFVGGVFSLLIRKVLRGQK